jgi:hypothetical protein
MVTDLQELANNVTDEKGFLSFVSALAADWHKEQEIESQQKDSPFSAGALGWENGTVGSFLEAAGAWGEASIDGLKAYTKPSNPWCRAAHILLSGKFYE